MRNLRGGYQATDIPTATMEFPLRFPRLNPDRIDITEGHEVNSFIRRPSGFLLGALALGRSLARLYRCSAEFDQGRRSAGDPVEADRQEMR